MQLVDRGLAPIEATVMTLSQEEKAYFDIEKVKNSLLRGADGVVLWVCLVLKQVEMQLRQGVITPSSMMSELDSLQGSSRMGYGGSKRKIGITPTILRS